MPKADQKSAEKQRLEHSLSVQSRRRRDQHRPVLYWSALLLVGALIAITVFILFATGTIKIQHQKVKIVRNRYGQTVKGEQVHKYVMRNKNGMEVQFITLGGAILSISVPGRTGQTADVVLGYKDIKGYEEDETGTYFGMLIGRVANRISNGTFVLDGVTYQLDKNDGSNQLHGGFRGWNKAVWESEVYDDHVILSHTSRDGDAGYPGNVTVNATVQLTVDNQLLITFTARAQGKATPINLTPHPYFNLGGHASGDVLDHVITIYADKYLPVSDQLIPTGNLRDVFLTPFDLREQVRLGNAIGNLTGYDHNFCIQGPTGRRRAARVEHPGTGRVLEVFTNQPGLQFYTGNFLNVSRGTKGNAVYERHSGFCLEPQNYPDAINIPSFPDCVLRPGSIYKHQTWYKFSIVAS